MVAESAEGQQFVLDTIEAQLSAAEQLDPAPEPGFWTRVWRYVRRPRIRWLLIGLAVLVALIIAIYDS